MILKLNVDQLNNIFVTSDHHFGHENIIKFCDRPFKTVEEMDQALIDNWNKVVKPDDLVFHLGDFTLGDWDVANRYFGQLNGRVKVLSNPWHHDKRWIPNFPSPVNSHTKSGKLVDALPPMVVLEIPSMGTGKHPLAIVLCHYPLAVWDRKHYGAWHLHGHSHGNYNPGDDNFILDVGVDNLNHHPISLGNILTLMYEMGW